jgi:hypothetical protein
MNGQRRPVGGRKTYFPPFVNERFDGPPWWACTFTALLNGANVGFLGSKPATHQEIRALAVASGDVDLNGGSRSSHMVRAMRVRYGQQVQLERLTPRRAQERLASGWALVAAVTYGSLPKHYRRWSPRFKKGHRVTLIGWDQGRTMLLDPLATAGASYAGEPIRWRDFEPAWWSGEQLWFAEGMFTRAPTVRVLEEVPEGIWRLTAGSRLVARLGRKPQVVARDVRVPERKVGRFDALVELVSASGKVSGPYLRMSSGSLTGMLVPAAMKGLTTTSRSGPTVAAVSAKPKPKAPTAPKPQQAAKAVPADPKQAFLEGRRAEWRRLSEELGPVVNLPPKP